jgi:hypothetical protein
MQVFQPSSVLSVVMGQPVENTERRGWYCSLVVLWLSQCSVTHGDSKVRHSKIYRESSKIMPRSLATDKIVPMALLSIQYDFCHVQTTGNVRTGWSQTSVSSIQLGTLSKTSSNSEFQVGNSGLFLELWPEDHGCHDSTLSFPVVLKAP